MFDADTKSKQEIDFTVNVERDGNITFFDY